MAGVSPSTVSRALQDHPRISDPTKRRILRLLARNGYHTEAERVSKRISVPERVLGFAIANPQGTLATDHFFSETAQVILNLAQSRHYHLLIEQIEGHADDPLPKMVMEDKVAGLVVGGVPIEDEYVARLRRLDIPVVFIGKYTDSYRENYAVIPDNEQGGYVAGKHLIDAAYEDLWYLGGSLDIFTFRDRFTGFKRAVAEMGRPLSPDQVLTGEMDELAGYRMAAAVVKDLKNRKHKTRTGVFAGTDWVAAGIARRLAEEGYSVPDEVGIVGYSDTGLAAHVVPPLTSIRSRVPDLAFGAIRMLEDLLSGQLSEPVQLLVQPLLVVRDSSRGSKQPVGHIRECLAGG